MGGRNGFTLVEILVVVLIIGILAAIAIPRFTGTKERAYLAAVRSDLRNLLTAQEAYQSDQRAYATGTADLTFNTSTGVTVTIVSADSTGWSATGSHSGTSRTCGIYAGTATPPAGISVAGAATCP